MSVIRCVSLVCATHELSFEKPVQTINSAVRTLLRVRVEYGPSGSYSELFLVTLAWSDWKYFYAPLPDGMPLLSRVTPALDSYSWVEGGTARVKRLALERNTVSPIRAPTRKA